MLNNVWKNNSKIKQGKNVRDNNVIQGDLIVIIFYRNIFLSFGNVFLINKLYQHHQRCVLNIFCFLFKSKCRQCLHRELVYSNFCALVLSNLVVGYSILLQLLLFSSCQEVSKIRLGILSNWQENILGRIVKWRDINNDYSRNSMFHKL